MTPKEMAILLHELFPNEISRFIGFVETAAQVVITDPVPKHNAWKPNKMTIEGWVQLAKEVHEKITTHRQDLLTDSKLFGRSLFTGYTSLFLLACLQDYVNICPDFRFKLTIEAFFEV